jgi:hypothetical protein
MLRACGSVRRRFWFQVDVFILPWCRSDCRPSQSVMAAAAVGGALVEYHLVPHKDAGYLVLELPFGWRTGFLCHTVSQEKVPLPPIGATPWSLEYNADGFGYLDDGEESIWCQPLLASGIYSRSGQLYLKHMSGKFELLADAMNSHAMKAIKVSFGASLLTRLVHEFAVKRFVVASGTALWWRMSDVYVAGGLHVCKGKASGWLAKKVKSWVNVCERLGLPAVHLLRPAAGRSTDASGPSKVFSL